MLQKIRTLIGFATRAGKVSYGQELVIRAVRTGKAHLVIMALDVSEGSKKKLGDKCRFYEVDLIELMDREDLSKCIGKIEKTCVAINDKSFADSIKKYYEAMQNEEVKAV